MAEVLGPMAVFYTALLSFFFLFLLVILLKGMSHIEKYNSLMLVVRFCCSTFVFIMLLNPLKSSLNLFIFVRFIYLEDMSLLVYVAVSCTRRSPIGVIIPEAV